MKQSTKYRVLSTKYNASATVLSLTLSVLCTLYTVLFSSCHTQKKIVEVPFPVKLKGENVIQLFDSVLAHQFNFNWLTAKAQVEYSARNTDAQSFEINLRVHKDSAIWISVTPLLGIEVARVLITRDSLQIIDRLHKIYLARDYNYLQDLLKSKVNFEIIQAVLVGNYFPYMKNEKLRSVYEDSTFIILSTLTKHQTKRLLEDKDVNKPVIQDFWIDGNYKIHKSKITDDKLDRTLEASYTNFFNLNADKKEANAKLFPQSVEVTAIASSPLKIKVIYDKVTAEEPITLPFTVPESYERR